MQAEPPRRSARVVPEAGPRAISEAGPRAISEAGPRAISEAGPKKRSPEPQNGSKDHGAAEPARSGKRRRDAPALLGAEADGEENGSKADGEENGSKNSRHAVAAAAARQRRARARARARAKKEAAAAAAAAAARQRRARARSRAREFLEPFTDWVGGRAGTRSEASNGPRANGSSGTSLTPACVSAVPLEPLFFRRGSFFFRRGSRAEADGSSPAACSAADVRIFPHGW